MKRTQIYLDEKLHYLLKEESRKSGKTISEIIRNRLWNSFKENSNRKEALLKALDKAFGAWEERDMDPESFVRELRKGNRIDSFGY
ncbi:ribbon-helix-helix protein, CopG family [Desulfurobacterium thermolithotrophum DSM 11699]|uniref:Ribbon-helix-helix protein, CopG family n=1 Tax=Desulfurobacterium thermolithotrophum (strain DSM 11699 / BSA) TaxID=868864 RepID=F0S162_DESTD|nr:ribbon-helix-helix protein, CopG family [Desulfurobacterium thermolithotrophum]ADY73940.1 ribbon-helix-helix protein, CopG family [Desulfurobacterium thermolithotrophum DSM 11699]